MDVHEGHLLMILEGRCHEAEQVERQAGAEAPEKGIQTQLVSDFLPQVGRHLRD